MAGGARMRSFVRVLEGPVGDALGVLAGIVVYGAIGAALDPRDPVGLWCGQVCLAVVLGLTGYAGWQAWLTRSPRRAT